MDKFEKFNQITGYDIKSFFKSFVDFNNTYYPSIVSFYQGGIVNADAFKTLDNLIASANVIEPLFSLHSDTLDDISMWDILDDFTEIQTKLETIKNSDRWLRSSSIGRDNTIQISRKLRSGEDFETVSLEKGDEDPENDWRSIVTPQYIEEEDYDDIDGMRNTFYINMRNTGSNEVSTVIDTLIGDKILGKDISVKFSFDETGDLITVNGHDAMIQALNIIASSLTGSIPEFPDYGISNEFIGTTVNAIQYPSIFKSVMNMFQRDSRWESVELLDLRIKEDNVFLTVKAKAITNQEYLTNITV